MGASFIHCVTNINVFLVSIARCSLPLVRFYIFFCSFRFSLAWSSFYFLTHTHTHTPCLSHSFTRIPSLSLFPPSPSNSIHSSTGAAEVLLAFNQQHLHF